jgi:hypothetical protein
VGSSLAVHEIDKLSLGTATTVCLWFRCTSGKELDRRIGADTLIFGSGLRIFGFRINLRDDNVRLVDEV